MNWIKVDINWWRGYDGKDVGRAWIRRVTFGGFEKCDCPKCNGKLIGITGERFVGWINGGPVSGYYRNFGDIKKLLERNINDG